MREVCQNLPLRTGKAGPARILFEAFAQQARDIVQKEAQRGYIVHGGRPQYLKHAYNMRAS
jgi:acetylglutamate kinase